MDDSITRRRLEREQWHANGGKYPPDLNVNPADNKAMRAAVVQMTNKAIRDGILKPWPVCAVPTCNQRRVQAHHTAYDPGDRLYVTWLCRRCHHQLHAEHRAQYLR